MKNFILFLVFKISTNVYAHQLEENKPTKQNTAVLCMDMINSFFQREEGDLINSGKDEFPVNDANNNFVSCVNSVLTQFDSNNIVYVSDCYPENHLTDVVNYPGFNAFDIIPFTVAGCQVQSMWPKHAKRGSLGANFHQNLSFLSSNKLLKATDVETDSFTAFMDKDGKGVPAFENGQTLEDFLKQKNIKHVVLVGVDPKHCIFGSGWHAAQLGFKAYMVNDAIRTGNMHSLIRPFEEEGGEVIQRNDLSNYFPWVSAAAS